ncbi:hypothetical protein D0Z00_003136 [Geotrichum galactomycetum]|uniref:Uncharacterized protein n=1 Tax=Geotrichum galactomycetum TaxID=27317 RepID=A0ACB6V263_9ASCO|nr:hypothetical protein D0Z00_003136 [Geotrichum candidum]
MDHDWIENNVYFLDGTEPFFEDWIPSSEHSNSMPVFKYERSKDLSDFISTEVIPDVPFEILSTIRYEPNLATPGALQAGNDAGEDVPDVCFFLLSAHHQRLQYAIDFFHWDVELPYDHFVGELRAALRLLDHSKSYKMRALVSKNGELTVEATEIAPRRNLFSGLLRTQKADDPQYTIYLDSESIMVGPFTSFKTTNREVYSKSRERSLRADGPEFQEVLLYNPRDEITEGSITNIALFRDGSWKTPPLGVGCLCGVTRNHLLSTKIMQEATIDRKSLQHGEPVLIFNGIIGVCRGTLVLK